MRHFLIDTDTASDDAVAIVNGVKSAAYHRRSYHNGSRKLSFGAMRKKRASLRREMQYLSPAGVRRNDAAPVPGSISFTPYSW